MNIFIVIIQKALGSQQPLDIFRERQQRMRLVAFAPLLCLTVVLGFVSLYRSSWQTTRGNATTIAWSLLTATIWLIVVANARKLNVVSRIYASPATSVRFLVDLPFLLLSLGWILWCFYSLHALEYSFLLNLYALIVFSATRTVSVPLYSVATLAIGLCMVLALSQFWPLVVHVHQPGAFNSQTIIQTFGSLYLGLHFVFIQEYLVKWLKVLFKIMARLFEGVQDDDQDTSLPYQDAP